VAGPDLGCRSRLIVGSSAVIDVGIRTALASVLTAPMGAWALRSDLRRESRLLKFYRDLAAAGDPAAVFLRPTGLPEIVARPRSRPSLPGGEVSLLSVESPYAALHPEVRREYASHAENAVAWAQHWRHDDGPRPTLVVIHGFGASPYWFNSRFFSLPWLYRRGYDVLLYLLPFHGVRQARFGAFSGWGLFAHGVAQLNEAMIQAIYDLRLFLDHLERGGVRHIAVMGLSLGGYITALLAAVDARPVAIIPNAPVVSMPLLIRQWFPASLFATHGARAAGIEPQELDAALAIHSPLTYRPIVPHERRMIIGGLGDRLAPPEQSSLLWQHWDRPAIHWFPGSHLLHAGQGAYLREMESFIRAACERADAPEV
jgi:pimeloyl-ACP methyl ester carboxylesterase